MRRVAGLEAEARRIADRLKLHPGRGGCGVGAIADPAGPSRELIDLALTGLSCVEHRGGTIDETGDGAGLLFTAEGSFFERFISPGKHLPEQDQLGIGVFSFPFGESANVPPLQARIDGLLRRNGLSPLGWRRVPVDSSALGVRSRQAQRDPWQALIGQGMLPDADLPMAYFRVKAEVERQFPAITVVSFSPRTVVYKALATGPQLERYYADLRDPELVAGVVLFHRRYSTNTLSNWALTQPFRIIAHNGEINTIKANRSAVASLERELSLGGVLMQLGSDSADLDRAVELFTSHGVSLPETILRLMPAAWRELAPEESAEARFSKGVQRALGTIAAWEGPAGIVAYDGHTVVAALDRMGLRPLRYLRTVSGRLIISSEIGAVAIPFEEIAETGQLDPGEVVAFYPKENKFLTPSELRRRVATSTRLNTYELAERELRRVPSIHARALSAPPESMLALFGWTGDRVKTVRIMAEEGKEPIVGMGYDRPLALFSQSRPPLSRYFKQIVAVVTNPPIDPIREGGAFDLSVHLGPAPDAHEDLPVYDVHPQWRLESPILAPDQLAAIEAASSLPASIVLDTTCDAPVSARSINHALSELGRAAVQAVRSKSAAVLILSDRRVRTEAGRVPLPILLAVASVHNSLTQQGFRRACSVIADSGEVAEGHDIAVIIGNGATAVCPWLLIQVGCSPGDHEPAIPEGAPRLLRALDAILCRVMSKMGICSVDGYRGARLFEAVGISPDLVEFYLPGILSRVGGIDLEDIAEDLNARTQERSIRRPEDQGIYRKEIWQRLQEAARGNPDAWGRFVRLVEDNPPVYLRDLLRFKQQPDRQLPVSEVTEVSGIIQRHLRGAAMSHGALHRTAHRAIAAAFNDLGGMSNCGEGGEDERRNRGGVWENCRSKIRQVASARFGVDATYLVNADELEIKIGQGAKPGEGGHLPAHKVTAEIAAIRRTRPGQALISPPPHHDIYSIEDLAQLIFSLRAVNPKARISVKCPAVSDLGTIAAGVAKAGADVISISGYEGGTGAAAASSIEHAGLPLELGVTDAHQTLIVNGIRHAVKLRADGGLKTAADVLKLMALGADEVSLGTALCIAEQCIFCHGCAKGNCPAGITAGDDHHGRKLMQPKTAATRAALAIAEVDPIAAEEERFADARAAVKRYLVNLAEDMRRYLAALGLKSSTELVGRVDLLEQVAASSARADSADLSGLLVDLSAGAAEPGSPRPVCVCPSLEDRLVEEARQSGQVSYRGPITTAQRSIGARLSGGIARGEIKLREPASLEFEGYAGQGFGFALVSGLQLRLVGFANDTVGEVMGGGQIAVVPPAGGDCGKSLVGNAAAYGATGGKLFVAGRAGQRFGVRNSAATLVCEGAGKYAFEYMTGGIAAVLGPVSGVVGSGMTGGELFLLDEGTLEFKLHSDARWAPIDGAAAYRLKDVLQEHLDATGSARAAELLADVDALPRRFRRAVPAS